MQYEKAIMRLTELKKKGFPEEFLLRAYRIRGQRFAQKQNPFKRNSPIIFDTEEFEKWRQREMKLQNSR